MGNCQRINITLVDFSQRIDIEESTYGRGRSHGKFKYDFVKFSN